MPKSTWLKAAFVFVAFLFFFCYALEIDSFARIGGGRSSGFRGSRSYSAPSRPAPSSPSGPSRSYQSPSQPPSQPGSGFFGGGGFLRSMAGGIAGGLLGGMLFRGLGFGAGGGSWGGGGIGLFEILLIAAILYFIYRYVKRRREQAAAGAYYQSASVAGPSSYQQSYEPTYAPTQDVESDLQAGLRYIRQMDPGFDEKRFEDQCMDVFFKVQGAWGNRDISPARTLFTDEMFRTIQGDADRLKTEKRINKLDNIAVRSVDIVEAWQESGRDYITVRFYANLVDYTVDESTGQVVEGSKTDPVKFEEYWTFTRSVGSGPWQLSAITQPQ
jgi:predicted lipid-binding transport protein (Tim44 family)